MEISNRNFLDPDRGRRNRTQCCSLLLILISIVQVSIVYAIDSTRVQCPMSSAIINTSAGLVPSTGACTVQGTCKRDYTDTDVLSAVDGLVGAATRAARRRSAIGWEILPVIPWSLYTLKFECLGITAVSELSVHVEVSDSFSFSLDYCDAFLTHDSTTVRKQHNAGFKHKSNVRSFYSQFVVSSQQEPGRQIVVSNPSWSRLWEGKPQARSIITHCLQILSGSRIPFISHCIHRWTECRLVCWSGNLSAQCRLRKKWIVLYFDSVFPTPARRPALVVVVITHHRPVFVSQSWILENHPPKIRRSGLDGWWVNR